MDYYAGIDVFLKKSSGCVVDAKRKVVRWWARQRSRHAVNNGLADSRQARLLRWA